MTTAGAMSDSDDTGAMPVVMPPSSPRNRIMDTIKAFGILSIVLAHTYPPEILVEFVQIYYIAVFFFVSGYFFKAEYFRDIRMLFRRRVVPLYATLIAWNLFYVAFEIGLLAPVLSLFGVVPNADHRLAYVPVAVAAILSLASVYSLAGTLWFVISLIVAIVLFGLIGAIAHRFFGRGAQMFVFVCVLLLFLVGLGERMVLDWPSHGDTALVGLLVLYAGYLYRQHETRIRLLPVVALPCAALVFLLRGTVDMTIDRYGGPLVFIVAVTAALYALLYLGTRLQHVRFLNFVGRNSLFLAATHFLAFKLVALVQIAVLHLPLQEITRFPIIPAPGWWALYYVGGVGIPMAVKLLIDNRMAARRGPGRPDTAHV